ncbi:MAG TPA: c-type cytochrome [Micropepsaceae bacterium]|nr:c-type cytochrome [Micropepsaceae bacterium]
MKRLIGLSVLLGTVMTAAGALYGADVQGPDWAYAVPPPAPKGAAPAQPVRDDGSMLSVPGSDKHFTFNQVRGRKDNDTPARVAPADWFPQDHPQMPSIVEKGDESRGIIACSLCHYPNGKGRSENASPAALPYDYIVRQLHDMRDGTRTSSERRKQNTQAMIGFAKAMTEDEIRAAGAYFSAMNWTPWIKVVESATAPKARSAGGLWIPLTGAQAGTEPLGNRIIEVPEDPNATETLRNPRSGFIAYVPMGAVAKGKEIVTTGAAGKTIACTVCHGENLNGIGPIPGIAARSPSYLARQLWDIKQGARHGEMTTLMKPVVANLTNDDIINITAYVASLPAPATSPLKTAAK